MRERKREEEGAIDKEIKREFIWRQCCQLSLTKTAQIDQSTKNTWRKNEHDETKWKTSDNVKNEMKSSHDIRPKNDEEVTRTRKTIDDWRVKEGKRETLTGKKVSIENRIGQHTKERSHKKPKKSIK